jgi:hypothetical protein
MPGLSVLGKRCVKGFILHDINPFSFSAKRQSA